MSVSLQSQHRHAKSNNSNFIHITFEFHTKQGTSTSLPRTFSPDFRIDNLKTLVSTQSRPLISFLKFSVFSFLLTRHASLSHSDRREGGEFYFFVHAIFTFYAYHSLSCFLFFVLSLCFRTSASLSRETQTQTRIRILPFPCVQRHHLA